MSETNETIKGILRLWKPISGMVSTYNWSAPNDHAVSFRFKNPAKRVNTLKTIYDRASDTYRLEFGRVHGLDFQILETFDGVYVGDAHRIFREVTGLETRMPRIVGLNC